MKNNRLPPQSFLPGSVPPVTPRRDDPPYPLAGVGVGGKVIMGRAFFFEGIASAGIQLGLEAGEKFRVTARIHLHRFQPGNGRIVSLPLELAGEGRIDHGKLGTLPSFIFWFL
jgi:hypothetical protein